MTLKTVYKVWFLALLPTILISALYVALATKHYINSLPPYEETDFAALPYLVYAHSVGLACTGLIMAAILLLWPGFERLAAKKLARILVIVHVSIGLLLYVASHRLAFFFFLNPLAVTLFALLPYWCWRSLQKGIPVLNAVLTLAIAGLIILWQGIAYMQLFILH